MESNDLKYAYEALQQKQDSYNKRFAYYDGNHPLVYTASRLKGIFDRLDARFTANWCAVVIDSAADRLALTGWTVTEDQAAADRLASLWVELDLQLESDDTHKAALICGEAFVITWKENDAIQLYYNDPRLCAVFYDSNNPHVKRYAAKWWDTDDGKRRLTLYYPDRLEYYVSKGKASNISSYRAFIPDPELDVEENPFGVVPVFHFRTDRRISKSDLTDVIPLQNGINKLLIDMMVAAEFGAFKQKYVISNTDIDQLNNAPNEIWNLPASDDIGQPTSVGEFSATDLRNYLDSIDRLAMTIGAITRTPKHFFFAQGGDPSGEALLAMEAPLNKKVKDRIERFAPEWRRLAAFLLKLSNLEVQETAIQAVYQHVETVQPFTQAQTRQTNVSAGIPLKTQLRREGWSESELEQLEQDKHEEQQAAQVSLATALRNAEHRFNTGEDDQEQDLEKSDV